MRALLRHLPRHRSVLGTLAALADDPLLLCSCDDDGHRCEDERCDAVGVAP